MGSLVKLMENESVVVALVRIRDKGESEHSVPLGFKINREKIPTHIKFNKFHSNNMHNLTVPGVKPLPVMIVCLGEDSQEIIPIYSTFCEKTNKERKIPGLTNKINHWIQVSGITLSKIDKSMFKPVLLKEFNSFMKSAESSAKSEKGGSNQKEVPPEVVTLTDENSSSAAKPTLSVAESSKTSFSGSSSFFKEHGSSFHDYENLRNLISSTKDLAIKYRASAKVLSSTDRNKPFFNETAQIFMNLLEIVDNIERSMINFKQEFPTEPFTSDLRIISEEDQTREQGKTTFIEGFLPVKTSKYKKAIASLPPELNDREPSHVIATIAKICFPDHWVNGVTLKGSGGNKSLLDLWNYENPLKFPVSGKFDRQLGFDRYQALLDHTMRKCGKKSYHSDAEKHLSSVISKAIHYKRTKINQPKGWDDITDSDADSDSSDDEIILPPRTRSSRNRIGESPVSKHSDLGNPSSSRIINPIVSIQVGSPIPDMKESKSGNESGTNETGDDQKKDPGKNTTEDREGCEKEEVDEFESKSGENEIEEPKQGSQHSDFKFDDDDDLLNIDYLKASQSPSSLFDDPDPPTAVENDESDDKIPNLSLKVVKPVFSSTPVNKKINQAQDLISKVTPIKSNITPTLKDTRISDSISSESGIEVSKIESSCPDVSMKSSDQLSTASTSENKRKLSNVSVSNTKKIKSHNDDHDEESDASTLSAGSAAPIKFMDPKTLAFINDPANVAFLQQLIASKAAQSSSKN